MILVPAEARIALGLAASITDADRGLIELLLPMVDGAIKTALHYDPIQKEHIEWYPRVRIDLSQSEGTWDSDGTKAYWQSYSALDDCLQLEHLPVRSIGEVKVDYNGGFGQKANTFGNDTIQTAGTDYFQDQIRDGLNMTGHLYSRTGWPAEPGSVKVTYTAGYSNDEFAGRASTSIDASPIKHAALITILKAFKSFKANQKQGSAGFVAGQITSESLGSYSYQIDGDGAGMLTGFQVSISPEADELLQKFKHYGLMAL